MLPFLSVDNSAVRDAAVIGLGSINMNLYRTLLESLQGHAAACAEEAKTRLGMHTRTVSSPRRNRRTDHLRTEITPLHSLYIFSPSWYDRGERCRGWGSGGGQRTADAKA